MPTIADYKVVQGGSTTLNDADPTAAILFDTPDVNTAFRPVLTFRVHPLGVDPTGSVELEVNLNGTDLFTQSYGSEVERVWQHVCDAEILDSNAENQLTMSRTAGPGDIKFSDIVIYFQTNI